MLNGVTKLKDLPNEQRLNGLNLPILAYRSTRGDQIEFPKSSLNNVMNTVGGSSFKRGQNISPEEIVKKIYIYKYC